jgi:hypothetical protein
MWHRLSRRLSGTLAARTPRHRRRPMCAALRPPEALEPRRLLSNTADIGPIVVPPAVLDINPGGPMIPAVNPGGPSTWYVDSSFTGTPDGSQADPFTTIQAAISAASPGDTILVQTGNGYDESDTIGVANLTIEAAPGASPVLNGDEFWAPEFTVTAGGVTISGLTMEGSTYVAVQVVAGGSATISDSSLVHDNVGIANSGGTVAIINDTIRDDQTGVSVQAAAPIYVWPFALPSGGASPSTASAQAGTTTIVDSTIVGNSYVGLTNNGGTITVTDTTISGNRGSGGIDNQSGAVTLTNCTVTGNSASTGGGIDNDGAMTINGGSIAGNSASTGGGIYNDGTLTMTGGTIAGNTASGGNLLGSGGGIANLGTLTVTGVAMVDNSAAGEGGGLSNEAGTATVTGCTIANNWAGVSGGGVANLATINVAGSTVADNSAARGGGLDNEGTMTLADSQVTGNVAVGGVVASPSANEGGGINNGAGTLTVTGSNISGNSAGTGGGLYNDFTATANVDSGTISGNSAGTGGSDIANDGMMNIESSTVAAAAVRDPGGFIRNGGGRLVIVHSHMSSRVRHGIVRKGGTVEITVGAHHGSGRHRQTDHPRA